MPPLVVCDCWLVTFEAEFEKTASIVRLAALTMSRPLKCP